MTTDNPTSSTPTTTRRSRSFWLPDPSGAGFAATLPKRVAFTLAKTSGRTYECDISRLSPATLGMCIARGLKERVTDSMAGEVPADPVAHADAVFDALVQHGWAGAASEPPASRWDRWIAAEASRAIVAARRAAGAKPLDKPALAAQAADLASRDAFAARMRPIFDAMIASEAAAREASADLDLLGLGAEATAA